MFFLFTHDSLFNVFQLLFVMLCIADHDRSEGQPRDLRPGAGGTLCDITSTASLQPLLAHLQNLPYKYDVVTLSCTVEIYFAKDKHLSVRVES